MLLYYVRHGHPTYNPDQLTPLGKRQAEAVARRLALHGIDSIYASTSNRAIETAQPTAEILGKEIVTLDFANEAYAHRDFSIDTEEGRRWFFATPKIYPLMHSDEICDLGFEWYKHPVFSDGNFEEGMKRIARESDAFLATLGYVREGVGKYRVETDNDQRVALFAHQGFGLAFLSHIVGIPLPRFWLHFNMSHSCFTVIHFNNFDGYAYPRILTLSNDSHIYESRLPTKYNNFFYI